MLTRSWLSFVVLGACAVQAARAAYVPSQTELMKRATQQSNKKHAAQSSTKNKHKHSKGHPKKHPHPHPHPHPDGGSKATDTAVAQPTATSVASNTSPQPTNNAPPVSAPKTFITCDWPANGKNSYMSNRLPNSNSAAGNFVNWRTADNIMIIGDGYIVVDRGTCTSTYMGYTNPITRRDLPFTYGIMRLQEDPTQCVKATSPGSASTGFTFAPCTYDDDAAQEAQFFAFSQLSKDTSLARYLGRPHSSTPGGELHYVLDPDSRQPRGQEFRSMTTSSPTESDASMYLILP